MSGIVGGGGGNVPEFDPASQFTLTSAGDFFTPALNVAGALVTVLWKRGGGRVSIVNPSGTRYVTGDVSDDADSLSHGVSLPLYLAPGDRLLMQGSGGFRAGANVKFF